MLPTEEFAEYQQVHHAVAPKVRAYFHERVVPVYRDALTQFATWAFTLPTAHPDSAKARRLVDELNDEMELAESHVTNAYSGLGDEESATAAVRAKIKQVHGMLRGHPHTESAQQAVNALDGTMIPRSVRMGVFHVEGRINR